MMTDRKKIIIIGSSILLIVIVIAGILALTTATPQPSAEPQNSQANATPEEEQPQTEDPHDHGTDAVGEPLTPELKEQIMTNASKAAQAFVTQEKDEKPEARASRLSEFFSPGSPALTAAAPINDVTYSTAQVTILETGWYDLEKTNAIGIIVYLNVAVDTGFGDYDEYQSWVVESTFYNNAWLARDIFKSDLPYVQGVS
ncbi:MAG TPA: hypothetical protein VFZ62_02230 [Candidatus Saccharimonadales bacterium]